MTTVPDLEKARSNYYARLADHFLRDVNLKKVRRILEAGCGKGQLTIPLLDTLPQRISIIAVDSSKASYAGSLDALKSKLNKRANRKRVRIINSDVRRIRGVANGTVDLVISNELLCDLQTETEVLKAFREFWRILRPEGMMIHGEWASEPFDKAQSIAIQADSPEGTDSPSRFWNADQLFELNTIAGFERVTASYFEKTLSFDYEAATKELRDWGVRESFLKRNGRSIRKHGIELPYEHLIRSQKPTKIRTRCSGFRRRC